MQVLDIAKAYETKTNEELLELATDPTQLTAGARAALANELARRRLDGENRPHAQEVSEPRKAGPRKVEQPSTPVTPFLDDSDGIGGFLADILGVYHRNFWFFIKLTGPAVALGYVVFVIGPNKEREIARYLFRDLGTLGQTAEFVVVALVSLAGILICWMALSVLFGAICTAIRQIAEGVVPSIADCLAKVRERPGPFVRLSLLLYFLGVVAYAAAGLLTRGVLWVLLQFQAPVSDSTVRTISLVFGVLATLVWFRFWLATPALVLDHCKVGQAVFRSDELTEGKWLTLAVLLAKGMIGGYFAAMCPFWLAARIPANVPQPAWVSWALTLVSFAGVTLVEPTLFIGFAVLYLKTSASSGFSSKTLPRQLA